MQEGGLLSLGVKGLLGTQSRGEGYTVIGRAGI